MSEKKVKYNEVFIAGEVLEISGIEKKWEDTPGERLTFKLHIETALNEVIVVTFDKALYKFDGTINSAYTGAETICREIQTKVKREEICLLIRINLVILFKLFY